MLIHLAKFPVWVGLAAVLVAVPCHATVVGISTIEQPVNLGAKADPARIPLGRVGVVNNHGYGIHRMIGEARACPDGAMRWDGGSELDQNLASVFGISVEPEDPTQTTLFPIYLRLKAWKPPGYSPYTKDQVLAATLWCLLRSAGGTVERPLDVRVVAEAPEDKPLEEKYSGNYVNAAVREGEEVRPPKVGETSVETDARGIAWVAFPGVPPRDAAANPPAMIILANEGDGDAGWFLLPVWGNGGDGDDFLRLNGWHANMLYSSYRSHGVANANSLGDAGRPDRMRTARGEKSDTVEFHQPHVDEALLAANILALVVSAQPTAERPLEVSLVLKEADLPRYPAFRGAAGWSEIHPEDPKRTDIVLKCSFVWDPQTAQLAKGSLPLVRMEDLSWIALEEPAEAEAE